MSEDRKPILCLDFDGVIHSYSSGWQGAACITDPPVDGSLEFLSNAIRRFKVAIFSSRSNQLGGIDAMRLWLRVHLLACCDETEANHIISSIEFPTEKPPALVTIDDRAITFTGIFPSLDDIAAFKPWNKKDVTV